MVDSWDCNGPISLDQKAGKLFNLIFWEWPWSSFPLSPVFKSVSLPVTFHWPISQQLILFESDPTRIRTQVCLRACIERTVLTHTHTHTHTHPTHPHTTHYPQGKWKNDTQGYLCQHYTTSYKHDKLSTAFSHEWKNCMRKLQHYSKFWRPPWYIMRNSTQGRILDPAFSVIGDWDMPNCRDWRFPDNFQLVQFVLF